MIRILLLLCILSFNLQAQDTVRFEVFSHYLEVDKEPPTNIVDIKINEPRTGYIIITSHEIVIVDQYGLEIVYELVGSNSKFYYINNEDFAYFIITESKLIFTIRTKFKNFHYHIKKIT